MTHLEDPQPDAAVRGLDAPATIVSVLWFGSEILPLMEGVSS